MMLCFELNHDLLSKEGAHDLILALKYSILLKDIPYHSHSWYFI